MKSSRLLILSLIGFLLMNCNPVYQTSKVQYNDYRIKNRPADSTLQVFLQPYSDSMRLSMGVVIANLGTDLEKKQPEGTLGDVMADAMFIAAEKIFGKKPDAAFMNYGGIRLNQLKAGVITRGKLYELFPFDNLLVTVTIKGTVFQQFLDHISGRGGWPVSGMTMQIKNGKAVNVLVGGKPLNPEATYSIVVGDYTANGGDEAAMLVGLPQQNKGYLMRDAIIDYFKSFAAAGTTIVVQPENRVTNVE